MNESPTDKLIRELREENARLMAMMTGKAVGGGSSLSDLPPVEGSQRRESMVDPEEKARLEEAKREAERELERQMEQNRQEMDAMKMSMEQRLKEAEQHKQQEIAIHAADVEKKRTVPHVWNMNEDPALAGMVCHFITAGAAITIGSKKANPPPDVIFGGMGIVPEHALLEHEDSGKVYLTKRSEHAKILMNGKPIGSDRVELHHQCRLLFGNHQLFCFEHPKERDDAIAAGSILVKPNYEDAMLEIAEAQGVTSRSTSEGDSTLALQDDLVQIMPHVNEANAISQELDKKCFFEVYLVHKTEGKAKRTDISIKVHDLARDISWVWSRETFLNRKYMMQEMYGYVAKVRLVSGVQTLIIFCPSAADICRRPA